MGVLTRLVVLCGTILVLDFTTVFCQSSALSTEIRKEHVCVNVDVRNSVNNFNALKNCTVIEGFLQILLIDSAETREYERLSFPRLREITGYLLLYRVYNLRTLANIFPNLAVIRGRMLFYNYALVAYEMNELQNLGLSGLTTIEKGAVRFEKNSHLCYLDTINWDLMTINRKDEHFFKDNRGSAECANVCPKNCPIPPKSTSPVCWNSDKCQIVPVCKCKYCYGDQCCHPQCIGGCSGPTQRDCIACQRVFHHGVCLSSCPNGTYEFRDRRCLTTNECISMDSRKRQDRIYYKTHQGKCLGECPPGYRVDKENLHKCTQCEDGKCPKICPHNWISSTRFAEIIDSVTSAAKLTGCNIVMANLEITISGGKNIAFELEKALGEIEEVHGYVKVARSYALISLSFFKKLRLIKGSGNRGLQMDKNAFVLLENTNLQEIWNLDTHPPLTIERGSMFFHYNRKLCLSKIDAFFNKTNTSQVRNEKDISRFTNGDEAACFVTKLKLEVMQVMSEVVIIKWTKFDIKDDRNLLSYVISYREAPTQDISILDGKDACSSNVWKTMDHQPVGHSDNTTLDINELIYNLKPYTQYAIYVQTYTISTAKQGAISNLVYFTTTTKEPTVPENVRVIATSEGLLKVSWKPPKRPNGNVTHYVVFYRPQLLDPKEFDKRNYCNQKLTLREKSQESRDKTETVSNVTVKDGQCCTQCPKTKEERERDELETQIQIRFENFLQSMVFQKRPDADSRRRRDVPYLHDPAVNGSYNPSIHATTIAVMVNGTEQATTPPTVKEEPKEIVWKSAIVYNKLETFLTNLKQFTIYNIQVIACHDMVNDVKRCSNSALATRQTLPKPKADNIPVNNITVTNINHGASQSILIKWLPPPDPNGLILLYEVEYQKIEDYARLQEKCIPHIKYTEVGGYQTPDLESGNYSLRLRVTSLAGNGSWTDLIYFSVAERPKVGGQANFWTPTVIGLVVSAMILILIISVAGVVFYFKRREAQRVPDSVLYASVNPDYWPGDVYVKDGWEVDRDKVQLLHELGQGSFGMVYEGVARELDSFPDDVKEMRIAVKTVNENASMRDRIEFLNEASVMKAFNNYHVVRLLGVVSEGQPSLVIMELMAQGDLKNYLRMHRPDEPDNEGRQPPSLKEILQMSAEIADGMAYLVAKKYVHRDLAARNCMVDEYSTVKIGDFGMTRDVYETDYYRKGGKGLLPVRWMSPESLKDGVFTSASDVWSYGVVLWEMATLAAQPYQGLANEQVLKYVVDGGLMEIPEGCPQRLYDLMMLTWQYYPKQRPTFQDIISTLVSDVDEHFREVSYYHSQENQDDLAKEADKVSSGDHGELEGLMDDSQLPLAPTDANNVKNDRTSNVRFANGEVYGIRGSGLNGHDSRVGSSGDNQSLAKTNSVVEMGNYNCLDLRRDSSLSRQTGSAIHSDDTGGGSKESSTSKSSSGSSHRNGFVNGHAHMPKSSEC